MDLADIEIAFEYGTGSDAERDEITRNVRNIILTPVGTCPLYRDFGIDTSFVDCPLDVAQNLIAVEIMEKIERYEPRVSVSEVTFDTDPMNGKIKARAVINRE